MGNVHIKKLSLAIYWHMHQPVYEIENIYLMPWARLHAVKDYLDMVLVLDKYPNLKLNIDIVPALLDMIIDYAEGANDIHSELSVAKIENMTLEEKSFVVNNFFSSKYETMIFKSKRYKELHAKRFLKDTFHPNDFNDNELSDLIALFNMVWIDPVHYKRYPRLQELWDKQYNYTLADRQEILQIQRKIIQEIIPTYKKYISEGRLELTVSPYYHPILPILVDLKNITKSAISSDNLPQNLLMYDDARMQVHSALQRIKDVFGVKPNGMWSPELCISNKTLELMAKEGVKWTISDEGTLSETLKTDFVRDFKRNLNDPYHLLKVYEYKTKLNPVNIIFRDRSIPNLINFEYGYLDVETAVNDLYGKIKTMQNKLLVSPDDKHLLTIALDGENCWENYRNDGTEFLDMLYSTISHDKTLETVLISDYIENDTHKKNLTKIPPCSWIDKTFQYWIGEPTKNKAWNYLQKAKDEMDTFIKNNKKHPNIGAAKRELLITQGSDWFWWYGEPNNSGQDFVFDYMFREHLKNIYTLIEKDSPEYLNSPLITKVDVPLKQPTKSISPRMDGLNSSDKDWISSGTINLIDGPVCRENKSINKVHYGCDSKNIYLRLYISKNNSEKAFIDRINQFYLYMRNSTTVSNRAYIRLISKTENEFSILKEKFEHELTLTLVKDTLYPPRLVTCLHQNMWTLTNPAGIDMVFKDVIDVTIPFETIGVKTGETLEFFIANTDSSVKNTNAPQEVLLSMTRK